MAAMVSRIVRWMSSSACVVTSPMTTHRPFVIAVSQATRACSSCPSMPSSTASETWSQTLSGWPSVTDSDVSRNEREELKEVVTRTDINRAASEPVVVARVLRLLAEEVRLEGEDVVEDAVDPPSLEPVICDHAGALEVAAKRRPEKPVDPSLAADLRLLEQLQAPVEGKLPRPVCPDHHSVP